MMEVATVVPKRANPQLREQVFQTTAPVSPVKLFLSQKHIELLGEIKGGSMKGFCGKILHALK